ncbi:ribose-5-phosphate isomerase RpiA [Paenibacillus bovis]|uniref:Ribose-5-phosphate isomerase A n=1 Tax=Paenibacillus bovis TaxID=1616788 RepID=A0A172ZH20_9BACL|nr:ribose-5-phosphate isomerase RpiA [Paenibacillus bovis]ANF96440.1 ribose 5-phosphate isomerase A [Paenibacillus bovis]
MNIKQLAAEKAVDWVEDGMMVGLGTGSTAVYAIRKLGERVQQGLHIKAVATSVESEKLAKEMSIPIIPFAEVGQIDLTIDGADEVDPDLNLIKGGGGALLREKIVAARSRQVMIVAGDNKVVKRLGAFPLPVEVVTFAHEWTIEKLASMGCTPVLRKTESGEVFVTDNGNYTVDCHFKEILNPARMHRQLNDIPGVVDNGLFIGMASTAVIAYNSGTIEILRAGK